MHAISSRGQIILMSLILSVFVILYSLPFEKTLVLTTCVFIVLFPAQVILWRLSYGRKAKDFLFCFSLLAVNAILKHYWPYADAVFYVMSILIAAVLRYRILLAITGSGLLMEILREHHYRAERIEEIAFRYLLFIAAGSITYILLWEEKRQKETFRKELDDLRYGIHQVEEAPNVLLSDSDLIARKVDAAVALDEALKQLLNLVHRVFKPDTTLLWQYLPDKQQLRIHQKAGNTEELNENMLLSMGEGPVGWTALNRKTFLQQDREEGIAFSLYRKNTMVIRSFLAIPVLEGDRLEGVLTLDSSQLNYFAPDIETAVTSFAVQISETIRMARLAHEREERAFEFQAFYHASKELSALIDFDEIIRRLHLLCGQIVHSDFSAIAIVQPEKARYVVYEWSPEEKTSKNLGEANHDGRTWISWYLTNREEPLILSESQLWLQEMPLFSEEEMLPDLTTYLVVPMRRQQNTGALILGGKQPDAFSSYEARILSILCNQAAVSLENATSLKRMEELAVTDGLTGLNNHRFLQEALDKELDRSDRHKQSFSLLIMDIDHFKGFNDSFGHPAGDFVLKSLAELLKTNARRIDILARYGGEEFAALLPGIDLKNARKTAERWRKSVQRASFKWESKSFAITLSIGFATFPGDGRTKSEIIEKADRGLYLAKEKGRNQVRHHSEGESKSSQLAG